MRLLLRLADKYGRKAPDATIIELEITQQELADMVGASRVMVANVLRQLHEEGLVTRREGRYLLQPQRCMGAHYFSEPTRSTDRPLRPEAADVVAQRSEETCA